MCWGREGEERLGSSSSEFVNIDAAIIILVNAVKNLKKLEVSAEQDGERTSQGERARARERERERGREREEREQACEREREQESKRGKES